MHKHYGAWGQASEAASQAGTPAEQSRLRANGNWNRLLGSHYEQKMLEQSGKMDTAFSNVKKMDVAGVPARVQRRWAYYDW